MSQRVYAGFLVCFLVGAALPAIWPAAQAQGAPPPSDVYEAAIQAGLPVVSVRFNAGVVEIVLAPEATAAQQATALALAAAANAGHATFAHGGQTIRIRRPDMDVLDALAVLRVQPTHARALAIVRAHAAAVLARR